eukprot:519463_1
MIEYYLRCDLYEGTEINKINGLDHDMFVQVEITHSKAISQSKKINDKNSSVKWYQTLVSQGNPDGCIGPFLLPDGWNENPKPVVLPDVFIYLCVKEFGSGDIEQVSYCRVQMNNIIPAPSKKGTLEFKSGKKRMWQNVPVWYDMKNNLASDKYSANVFPGALLIALNAGPKSDISKEDNDGILVPPHALSRPFNPGYPTHANDDEKKSSTKTTHADVTITCFEAVSLPAMDRGNQSDPYVEIVIEDENGKKREKECEKCKKNLNPKWNQDLEFDNVHVGDRLYLRVMDWDFGLDKDDEMGYIEPLILTGTDIEKWYPLQPSKEVSKKYKKKLYLIENMKIKIGIKYEWDDLDVDEDEREQKK